MHREQLLRALDGYWTPFLEEAAMVERTRRFIKHHKDCFDRKLRPGHVTASAWVLNPTRSHVLLLHHKKLDMWLQPGGHADGDPDVLSVMIKEVEEETGVSRDHIRLVNGNVFDVDVHVVYQTDNDPRHVHFDIRFLVEMDDDVPIPGNEESHAVRWVPVRQVLAYNNMRSIYRMLEKTRRMLTFQNRKNRSA